MKVLSTYHAKCNVHTCFLSGIRVLIMEGILSKPSAVDGLDAVSVSSEQLVTILVRRQ